MNRESGYSVAIRAFSYSALFGAVVVVAALIAGLGRAIPVGAALGLGAAGLLLATVCLREVRRAVLLRWKERQRVSSPIGGSGRLTVTRQSTCTSHIGRSLNVAAIGGALFCAALVTGLAGLVPAGVAAGLGGGGFVLWLVEVRGLIY
jgi:hypothetical protein